MKGRARLSGPDTEAVREVTVPNVEGVHARPVMRFVDLASTFCSSVTVRNVTRDGQKLDGKSAIQMMLLEATQGCVLRIEARGGDARATVDSLAALVEVGFKSSPPQDSG